MQLIITHELTRKIIVLQSLAAQIYLDERETLGTKDIVIR